MQAEKIQNQSFIYKWRDYISGSVGGVVGVLIGQPFDIVKVRLQASHDHTIKTLDVIKHLVRDEGILAFYKGIAFPLLGAGFMESIRFGVFQNGKYYLQNIYQQNKNVQSIPQNIDYYITLAAAPVAGIVTCFLTSPIEHIRIRIQMQKVVSHKYSNSFDCLKYIYGNYGIRGLYKGLMSCILRDSLGCIAFFGSYDGVQKVLNNMFLNDHQGHVQHEAITKLIQMTAGGVSGAFLWFTIYPIDTVKSKIQADSIKSPKLGSFMQILKSMNVKQMYKGVDACLMRAIPGNAGVFLAFEETKKYINKYYGLKH
ncbi:Mitochondrial carrier domain [Pseudocohnilembus persalinus]|uniref:Mitochondrial carrier domain n=1 Tax=Pseudocohnilembus persalinus TaxID=266149 RepID=A0A0V0QS08_PSEPJ|nr:Mitochondrial carrier domain [Pseudocohnilembus persalinus]|eukprot:KRX04977.1 Mitochondrial carrier domain [Pseudocohnilembus persalinus]